MLSSPPVVAAKRRPRSTSTVVERGQENYKGQGPEGHRPDYLCSFFGAAAAGDGLYDLSLFAGTGVLDKVPDLDDAIVAGVGALQALGAGVVCFYGVVVGVRVVRYSHGVNLLVRLAGSRGVRGSCGTIYVMERIILPQFSTSRLLIEHLPFTIERRYVRLGWRQTGGESIAAS